MPDLRWGPSRTPLGPDFCVMPLFNYIHVSQQNLTFPELLYSESVNPFDVPSGLLYTFRRVLQAELSMLSKQAAVSWILYSEAKPAEADPDLSLSHPEPRLQASSP